MKFLKGKEYSDAKEFAGECESVVIIAKGQSMNLYLKVSIKSFTYLTYMSCLQFFLNHVVCHFGTDVQGTCKYGTRVDYILGSQGLPYAFVPGSYSVVSSKGTSDHHIVKVEIMKVAGSARKNSKKQKKVVRMTGSCSSRGIWQSNT